MAVSFANSRYFTKEHIEAHKFDAPACLAEQAVHCLELVAALKEYGLEYQFKGGNSLLLILPEPARFSIDVDIATGESVEKIVETLDRIVDSGSVFIRWEKRQHKTKPGLPISSYYLFYRSHFDESGESNIMLDVQMRNSPYETELKPVVCGDLAAFQVKTITLPIAEGRFNPEAFAPLAPAM